MRRGPHRSALVAWAAIAVFAAGACTNGQAAPAEAPSSAVALGPEGPAFYTPPVASVGARRGDVIWARPLTSAPRGSRGFRVLYWSTTVAGELVAVSGVLYEPSGSGAGAQPPIMAWAHGTSGLGDDCAPSRAYYPSQGASDSVVAIAVRAGAVYIAPDYQGLGTPGEHPYMVNLAAARDLLDGIRAAARFRAPAGGSGASAVILGESQGGAAALAAAELQPTYAPDVRLVGSVAISSPTDLNALDEHLSGGEYFGFVLMAVHGYLATYPQLSRHRSGLTERGRSALETIPSRCMAEILSTYANRSEREFGLATVLRAGDFRALLDQNSPGQRTSVPVLILHGEQDETLPVSDARNLVRRYCASGTPVTARFYPGLGHTDILNAALTEIMTYVRDRQAGAPPTVSCPTPPAR